MKVRIECECGQEVVDFTRSSGEISTRLLCQHCGALYGVTVTALTQGDT